MSIEEIVNISIQWGPTILVALIMFSAFLTGVIRGFRKSTILALNALIAFILVIIAYVGLVSEPNVDEYVVTYANKVLYQFGLDSVQIMLGASDSSNSLREILTEILPTYMDYGEGVSAVIKDNGAYLGALVNSVYHIVFAIISSVIYYVLVFIFYILYLIFLPERRYKRKKHKLYVAGVGSEYKKHHLLGGLVGSLRGVVYSLVFLSFFGTLLFIVTGSDGSTESEDVKFGDEKIDEYYDIYEAVGEYGNYGIYSLLNSFKDKNNVPYYLFAADLVLSGSYEDRENNVSAEIIYREEFGNYVKFARSTVELLIKYGADDITPLLNGEEGDITQALTNVFSKEGFKAEFEMIIDDFEEDTFFINFALSAVDSIAKNINDFKFTESLEPQIVEILNILLVGEEDEVITVSNIMDKNDAKLLLSSIITIMAQNNTETEESEQERTISIIKGVLPQITQLSMFKDEKKVEKGNKVLANVYDYVIESLSNNDGEEVKNVITTDDIMKLTNKTSSQINWMQELSDLIYVGSDVLSLYENNYNENDTISGLLHMLDDDNPNKAVNKESLNNIIDALADSDILGLALSTTYVNDMLVNIVSSLAENIVLPQEVDYVRQYNSDGTVKTDGEIYTLLKSVELLLENDIASFYDKMKSEEGFANQTEQILELIDILLKEVELNGETTTVVDNLLDSKMLKYTLSQVLTNVNFEGISIVIPEECVEEVPENITVIKNEKLKSLVSNISLILPEDGEELLNINKIYDNRDKILENEMLHATIIHFFVNNLVSEEGVDTINIPTEYNVTKESLTENYANNIWVKTSEVKHILEALNAVLDISTLNINNINLDSIKISKTTVSTALESAILHATVSDIVSDTLTDSEITIPAEAKQDNFITKVEITNLVGGLEVVLGSSEDGIDINNINLDSIKISKTTISTALESIILHSAVSKIVSDSLTESEITIPTEAKNGEYITKVEITNLVGGLEVVLGSSEDGIDINNVDFESIKISKTTISTALESIILHSAVSKYITDTLTTSNIEIPTEAKESEYITKVEITNLVGALEVILDTNEEGIQINNFNIENIKLSSSDIDVLFDSKIIQRKVTVEVDKAFDKPLVDQVYVDNTRKDILKDEATKLLSALEVILPNSEDGINFNNVDVANIEITSEKVEVAYTSTIFAQIISDNILTNESIAGKIPTTALSDIDYTIPNENGNGTLPVALIDKQEVSNLINSIETLFNKPLSADTSFDINSAKISYGEGGLGNLMTILNSKIVECMISDTIITTLVNIPTTCLTETAIYNSSNKANIIDKNELAVLVEIVGSQNIDDNTYEVSVGEQMEFNEFDRDKINFIKESEIGRYKVSEILMTQQDLIIPVQNTVNIACLGLTENIKVLEMKEFGKFLDALNSVIPADKGFDDVTIEMPTNKDDYDIIALSDILRATITDKLEINGSAIFLEGDLDLVSYTDGANVIPVLTKEELVDALVAVSVLNGTSSSEFAATINLATLATFDDEKLDAVLNLNMLRYQVSELMKGVPGTSVYEKESIHTYTIINTGSEKVVEKSTDLKEVFTPTGIKQYINYIKSLA